MVLRRHGTPLTMAGFRARSLLLKHLDLGGTGDQHPIIPITRWMMCEFGTGYCPRRKYLLWILRAQRQQELWLQTLQRTTPWIRMFLPQWDQPEPTLERLSQRLGVTNLPLLMDPTIQWQSLTATLSSHSIQILLQYLCGSKQPQQANHAFFLKDTDHLPTNLCGTTE